MRRRRFLTLAVTAGLVSAIGRNLTASAQTIDLSAPLRVRLFAGEGVLRLEINGVVMDAAAGSLTTAGRTSAIGSQIVELSGDPYLDVNAITASGDSIRRRYPGAIFVRLQDRTFVAINQADVETYVSSVLSAEASPSWATESLRAQAIAVRTYAMHARLSRGAREFDLNDDTSSQVYRGIDAVPASFTSAAHDTAGQIVAARDAPASVFYSSSCGGHTASLEELSGQAAPPYLLGVPDLDARGRAYCSSAPYFRWKNSVSAASMSQIVDVPAAQLGTITVSDRWPDGRVKTVIAAATNFSITLSGREFYTRARERLGYKVVPSSLFDIGRDGQDFALVGHGVGHGVGMCQWGARGRADAGMDATHILQAYFPGTTIARI